jgi:hypothetical protein
MKYIKAKIPCNYFYYVVEDNVDITNLTLDLMSNKLKDASGNEVKPSNTVYCMGVNEEGSKATITQVDTIPFPEDKTI